jgi:hypothetical protein
MVTTAEKSDPSHKFLLLKALETADFKEYAQISRHGVEARDDQDLPTIA